MTTLTLPRGQIPLATVVDYPEVPNQTIFPNHVDVSREVAQAHLEHVTPALKSHTGSVKLSTSHANSKYPLENISIPGLSYPHLIVSPYVEVFHQLDITTLDIQNQLLGFALTSLDSATPEYATVPYQEALNWPIVFDKLRSLSASVEHKWIQSTFYVVEFRSQLKAHIDNPLLFQLDKESHREATASGGLLKYWYGEPDPERRNLATCLWRSQQDAVAGGKGPWHKQAREVIPKMYESINVTGLRLTIDDDVGGWTFEPWGWSS